MKRSLLVSALSVGAAALLMWPAFEGRPSANTLDQASYARIERLDLSAFVDATTRADASDSLAAVPIPATATGIGPGSHLLIHIGKGLFGCTANFVWTNGTNNFLGAAGHCFLPEGKTATHGPGANYNANQVLVDVCVSGCSFGGQTGFLITGSLVRLGPVAYARQVQNGLEIGNDFGLVQIPGSQAARIRPAVPVWGGPTSVGALQAGELVCHYGNGVLLGESFATMARTGIGIGSNANSWAADTAAAPGDSGSAVITCAVHGGDVRGLEAIGILTHLQVGTGTVAGTTVAKAKSMATQAGLSVQPLLAS